MCRSRQSYILNNVTYSKGFSTVGAIKAKLLQCTKFQISGLSALSVNIYLAVFRFNTLYMSHYFEFISFRMFLILGYTWCACYLAVLCILLVTFLGYLLGKFRVLYIEKANSWKCEKVGDCYCCLCIGLIFLFTKF